MVSKWQTFIDAVVEDLTTNVPGLRDALVHRYSPWDPEEQVAESGEKHLGVYPIASAPRSAEPFVTAPGGDLQTETYRISYWEDAGDESSRGISDEEATAAMFELAEAVEDRFYVIANLTLSNVNKVSYIGTAFPERSGQTRWFAIGVTATRVKQAT